MNAIDITDENFNQLVLTSGKVALVDFSAEWCPPCKAMKPVLEILASDLNGKAIVGKLDVDTNPEVTAKYGVRNLPTFLFFKDGNLIDRVVGAVPKSVLEQKVSALI
jgi:thioredoxin 1